MTVFVLLLSTLSLAKIIKVPLEKHYHGAERGNQTSAKHEHMARKYGHLKHAGQEEVVNGSLDMRALQLDALAAEARSSAQAASTADLAIVSGIPASRNEDEEDADDYGKGGTIKAGLNNFMHVTYIGPVSIGLTKDDPPASQYALVVYDTGSPWLAVTSSRCKNCPIVAYDLEKSATCSQEVYDHDQEIFGQAELIGDRVDDEVCVIGVAQDPDRNTCVKNFGFLAITEQYSFQYQGVLGFAPANASDDVPNFLLTLRDQEKIDEAIISFSLGHNSTFRDEVVPSYAIFGGVDKTEYLGVMYELSLATPYYWAPRVAGLAYGGVYLAKFDAS